MGFCLNLGFTGFKGTPSLRTAGRKGSLIVDFKITADMVGGQGCTLSESRAKVLEFLSQRTLSDRNLSMTEPHSRAYWQAHASSAHKHFCIFRGSQ